MNGFSALGLSLVFAGVLGTTALGQSSPSAVPSATPSAKMSDDAAVTYVIQDSAAMCRLALQKSARPGVKSFCTQMIDEHVKMISAAQALGAAIGASDLAVKPADESQIELAHLQRYSGYRFDEVFMKAQITDHRNDVDLLRDAMETTHSPQVKTWIAQRLTQLDMHLKLANDTLNAVERSPK